MSSTGKGLGSLVASDVHCHGRPGTLEQVRLLGPVDVVVDGAQRTVRGLRRKAVLATLALHAGEIVSTSRLVDVVWGRDAPAGVANTLQSHVSYLRTLLGNKAAVRAIPPGYVLDLPGDGTDVRAAQRLLREAGRASDPGESVRCLRQALGLWRGRPLADLAGLAPLEEEADHLDVLHVQLQRAVCESGLAVGEHLQLVPELERLATEHPLDEQLCRHLMVALYRSGRQADALAAYQRLRTTLTEELGIDPSQALRELETAILRQDPALDAPAAASPASPALTVRPASVPAQLPPAVPAFAGRDTELASLDALRPAQPGGSGAVVIAALSGTAGVGKTTLAVQWAHRVSGQFPDGQLYVNLRGFDPGGRAVSPGEAVCGFLEALGVAAAGIPAGLDAQVGLYRSLLAGKRILVLLDNARDASQVRPLLPGSPGCLAIVTSRDQLAGLVATDGAWPLALALLTTAEARDLLARRLGESRVAGDPDGVGEIIERCARLPLALAIAAARAAIRPGFPLTAIAAELRQAARPLDSFEGGDRASDVRAVFSWSYQALSPDAARLFRLLGLHPGPDIATPAVASLADVSVARARVLLAELARAHLLSEISPGRYSFHDLLRAYASELAGALDSAEVAEAAVLRVIDHYLHTAHNAATVMEPYVHSVIPDPPLPGTIVGSPAATEEAVDWLTAEHAPLLAAVRLAADLGLCAQTWQLAVAQSRILVRRGLTDVHAKVCETGLAAARRGGDIAGEAHCKYQLAIGQVRAGRLQDIDRQFHEVLRLFEETGDYAGQAMVHGSLTWVSHLQHRPADSLSYALRAQELFVAAGHRPGQAMNLNDIGFAHALLGNYEEGQEYIERSIQAIRELGTPGWEASSWDSLGYVHSKLGNHELAVTCYERSIKLFRSQADPASTAEGLDSLGDAHHLAGDISAAHRAWAHAVRIFDELGHPDADRVRAKLRFRTDATHSGSHSVPWRRPGRRPGSRARDTGSSLRAVRDQPREPGDSGQPGVGAPAGP
jgi:DNA-binding SARP family transcriptional activator/tetratricopeptide (TPR) repeat protein